MKITLARFPFTDFGDQWPDVLPVILGRLLWVCGQDRARESRSLFLLLTFCVTLDNQHTRRCMPEVLWVWILLCVLKIAS